MLHLWKKCLQSSQELCYKDESSVELLTVNWTVDE